MEPNLKAYFTGELGLTEAQVTKLAELAQAAVKKGRPEGRCGLAP